MAESNRKFCFDLPRKARVNAYSVGMENSHDTKSNMRRKNWILFGILMTLIIVLFAMSFVKFGEVVYS